MNKDHWSELRKRLLPLLVKRGNNTALADYVGVERQHVFKWAKEDVCPSYRNGKIIEEWGK